MQNMCLAVLPASGHKTREEIQLVNLKKSFLDVAAWLSEARKGEDPNRQPAVPADPMLVATLCLA